MEFHNDYINNWIREGIATILPISISIGFDNYINTISWHQTGTGLDWASLDGLSINLQEISEENLIAIVREKTLIGEDSTAVFFYSNSKPCIMVDLNFGLLNIDVAFWKSPGTRYMFGAYRSEDQYIPCFEHLLEYNGMDEIHVRI